MEKGGEEIMSEGLKALSEGPVKFRVLRVKPTDLEEVVRTVAETEPGSLERERGVIAIAELLSSKRAKPILNNLQNEG